MPIKSILTCFFSILFIGLFSQKKDSIYYIGYTSTGTFNKTNANRSFLYNNQLKFSAKRKNIEVNSNNKWLYGRQNKELTNNDFSSSWDLNLYRTIPHFYYWGLLNYNSIYSLKINNQLQTGAGVAYNIVDKKSLIVNLSDGVIYDYSDVILSDSTRDVYGTPRNSFRLQIKWNIKDRLVFRGNGFLQNSFQYKNDYIIRSDASITIKLKKWLSLTSAFSYNKMSRTKTSNLLLTYGITIENYF